MYVNVNGKIVNLTTEEYEALIANQDIPAKGPASKMDELIASVNSVAKAVEEGGSGGGGSTGKVVTYTLSKEGNTIKLEGSDNSVSSVEDANDNTTYNMSITDRTIKLAGSDNSVSTVDLPKESTAIISQSWDGVNRNYALTVADNDTESAVKIQYHLEKNDETNQIVLKAGDKVVDQVQLARDQDTKYTLVKEGNELRLIPSDGSDAIVIELDPDLNTTYTLEFNEANCELSLIPNDNSLPTVISLAQFADREYVDTELAKKANKSEIPDISILVTNDALNDTVTELNTEIGKKANTTDIPDVSEFIKADELEPYAKSEDVDNKLANKADKTQIPDVSGFAVKTDVDNALEKKADKTELPDLTPYAKTSVVETELGKKANSADVLKGKYLYNKVVDGNNNALIFNESDGGGSQYTHADANVISFVGVNKDTPDGINVQIYAKYIKDAEGQIKNSGSRLNVNPKGMFYTTGKTSGAFAEEDELVTKKDIPNVSEFVTGEDVDIAVEKCAADSNAEVNALKAQIEILTKALQDIKAPSAEEVTIEENVTVEGTDVVVHGGTVSGVIRSISGAKTVNAESVNLESARLAVNATDDVTITDLNTEGTLNKSVSNAATSINTNGNVTIKDSSIMQNSYNAIEIGLANNTAVKNVVIDGIDFSGKLTNNAITIFSHQKNAEIVISNCHFADCSNPIRLSNKGNVPAKIKFINCTCDKWETTQAAYAGFLMLEDYTSKTEEEVAEANRFANLSITFQNCYGPYGKIVGTGEELVNGEHQIVYLYADKGGIIPYDAAKFPEMVAY